jgi:hypothetical protein
VRLCQILHGPPATWEHLPEADLDWLLAVDDTAAKAQAARQEAANG